MLSTKCHVLVLIYGFLCIQGNIRVFCRVRPLLGDECLGNDGEISHIGFPDDDCRELELEKLSDVGVNEVSLNLMHVVLIRVDSRDDRFSPLGGIPPISFLGIID